MCLPYHTLYLSHGAVSLGSGGSGSHHMLCHPETMRVQLKSDDIGFGLSLHGGVSGKRYRPIKIAVIEDGGPAALLVDTCIWFFFFFFLIGGAPIAQPP